MSDELLSRRLPLYAYLESLLAGRKILEIGRGTGDGAEALRAMGARVVSVDADVGNIEDRFDVVLVADGDALVRRPGAVATWRKLLADKGRLIISATNADRAAGAAGIGYYELHDALATHFPKVQMLGLTPFLGLGVVEFEGAVDGLRIDARLVKEGAEPPVGYVAIGGAEATPALGYALIQLPFASIKARAGDGAPSRSAAVLLEEVEELRGRLRRAAEDRAVQDTEVTNLRRALAEADQSVMTLTRRTTEEMAAVAEKLASGFRAPADAAVAAELTTTRDEADRLKVRLAEAEARAAAAEQRLEEVGAAARERQSALEDAVERLRLADSELARARRAAARFEEELRAATAGARDAAESARALASRDDRIAALEVDKQDLTWRMAELEDRLRDAIARAVRSDGPRSSAGAEGRVAPPAGDEAAMARENRERAVGDFQRAAAVHVTEITELKASVAEQAALVAELEDALAAAETRAAGAGAEASTFRKTAKDMEAADRTRRSRLAELEGKLLRLEHERKQAGAAAPDEDQERQLRDLQRERDELRVGIEKLTRDVAGRNGHAADSLVENTLGNYRQLAGRLRDDLEGIRRRLESLSSGEIAAFLEELGEDLAELQK